MRLVRKEGPVSWDKYLRKYWVVGEALEVSMSTKNRLDREKHRERWNNKRLWSQRNVKVFDQ